MTFDEMEEALNNIAGIIKSYSKVHLWEYQKIKDFDKRLEEMDKEMSTINNQLADALRSINEIITTLIKHGIAFQKD